MRCEWLWHMSSRCSWAATSGCLQHCALIRRNIPLCESDLQYDTEDKELSIVWEVCTTFGRWICDWAFRGSNIAWRKGFSPHPTHPCRLWGPPSLLFSGIVVSSPGWKPPGPGVDYSCPCGAEVKNERSYTLIWAVCLCDLHRDKLTFTVAGIDGLTRTLLVLLMLMLCTKII